MDTHVQSVLTASPSERARALQPLLDEHGPEIDRRREVTPEVVAALAAKDMLRLLLPRSLGGQEIGLLEFCKTTEALGYADASVAWFVNQSNVSSATSAASMPRDSALAVFGKASAGLAWGARHGKSKAVRVEGGYRLTGTWSFASGGRHTDGWLGAHSAIQNSDGTPHMRHGRQDDRSFIFRRSDAKIIDDWHVLGLRGTGSDSYSVEDLFIPDDRAPNREAPEERREPGPIYIIGSTLLYATGFCGVALGVARRLFETYVGLAQGGKKSRLAQSSMAENNGVQRDVAFMEAKLASARAYLHEALGEVYAAAAAGKLSVDERMKLRLATTYGMNEATDVSVAAFRGAGSVAIINSQPFERRFRDAMSASQHQQAALIHAEMVGRHIIGVESKIQHI